ncbi:nucleotidyltransferase domain-containing protein [Bacillus sp. AK128]
MQSKNVLKLEKVSKELLLLLEIISKEEKLLINMNVTEGNYNWNQFIDLAFHHRIYSYIYPKLKAVNWIPQQVLKALSSQYKRNILSMLQLCGEMDVVNNSFIKNDIPLLFLKGPVLADSLYGDISLRTSCDIDALIPINQLDKAEAILLEFGYVKDDYIETVLGDWKWRHHHITFFHPLKRIKLELHWRLSPGPDFEPKFKDLWNRRRESSLRTSSTINFLGKEDLFMFLITHGTRHGWSRLRWLLDIKKLVELGLNEGKLKPLLKKYQSKQLTGQALILVSELLETVIPHKLLSLISQKKSRLNAQQTIFYLERQVNLHSEPLEKEVSDYHKNYLLSIKTIKQKLLFNLSCLHPYPTDLKTLPLPKTFHFLYFPLRPFLWYLRIKRKNALI